MSGEDEDDPTGDTPVRDAAWLLDGDSDDAAVPEDSESEAEGEFDKGVNLAELSDSSDSEGPLIRTGDVPAEWYENEEHNGYNIEGQPVVVKGRRGAIEEFLAQKDIHKYKRTIYDAANDRTLTLTKDEMKIIKRLRKGQSARPMFPGVVKPITRRKTAMSHGLEPKARFLPSKHEQRIIYRMVRAIRNGWIRPPEKAPDEDAVYNMWTGEDADGPRRQYVQAPKPLPPGHAASYNPPAEYLLDKEEKEEWDEQDPEDRKYNFVPQKFKCLRHVPGYDKLVEERFERCLDLYLCPRVKRKKLDMNPDDLLPELPNPEQLRPFPQRLAMRYKGHEGRVRTITVSHCGEWMASGGEDGTVRLWEVATTREMKRIKVEGSVQQVAFCPKREGPLLLGVVTEGAAYVIPADVTRPLPDTLECTAPEPEDGKSPTWAAIPGVAPSACVRLPAGQQRGLRWHRGGDYFATFSALPRGDAVYIHRLSKKQSQRPWGKSKGYIQDVLFHPSQPIFFVATSQRIRVYNLATQSLVKKVRVSTSRVTRMDVHGSGDHLIVGTADRRVCWFDLDMSKVYRTLRYHKNIVRDVCFHKRYPLFGTCSDDGSVHCFHGRVYDDLMKNPLIVPVKILTTEPKAPVRSLVFHPQQAWAFAASGSDVLLFT